MTSKNMTTSLQKSLMLLVATVTSYLHVFNKHSIKNTHTTHALKLFLTGKRKLREVTRQPRSLRSFAFWKACIGRQESAFKKDKKRALGTEDKITSFSMLSA